MTPTKSKIVIAFDLYGTILSTESIETALAAHLGRQHAPALAARWRQYQLEYTWRATAMGAYKPFDKITRAALHHAAADQGLDVPDGLADQLMRAYDSLPVFPDVVPALEFLAAAAKNGLLARRARDWGGPAADAVITPPPPPLVEAVVFSNGTDKMLRSSLDTCSDLKPFAGSYGGFGLFKNIITVDDVRTYKPAPASYSHLQSEADENNEALVWLVSANPFDVAGARSVGLRAAWIDRAETGWVDRLGDVIFGVGDDVRKRRARPTIVASTLDRAVQEIINMGI